MYFIRINKLHFCQFTKLFLRFQQNHLIDPKNIFYTNYRQTKFRFRVINNRQNYKVYIFFKISVFEICVIWDDLSKGVLYNIV